MRLVNVAPVSAAELTANFNGWSAIIDARSPAEFAEDHLPGALNWPVLDDEERRIVGTMYKQSSPFEARKLGAALVARRIAGFIDQELGAMPREWRPIIYCWRGGQRSGSLALVLAQIGFRTAQLVGGYRAFRAVVRAELDVLPQAHRYTVLCGRTGSGKTRLLHALAAQGAQVLDLEALACHRGSILGAMPGQPQPTQKRFDTLVWEALRGFDKTLPVFVESESARVGVLRVPPALLVHMHQHGRCIRIETADDARQQLLIEDYAELTADAPAFNQLLQGLVELRGHVTVEHWQALASGGRWPEVITELMTQHYDPLYVHSMQRSFATLASAEVVNLGDARDAALAVAAKRLLSESPNAPAPPDQASRHGSGSAGPSADGPPGG